MKTKILFVLLTGCLLAWLPGMCMCRILPRRTRFPRSIATPWPRGWNIWSRTSSRMATGKATAVQHPVAMTGLAGHRLAHGKGIDRYDGDGKGPNGKYSANIRKAVDWLMDKSQAGRDGLIFSEHPSETARYMQGHGLATLFLAGAYEDEVDRARRKNSTMFSRGRSSTSSRPSRPREAGITPPRWKATISTRFRRPSFRSRRCRRPSMPALPVPESAIHDAQEYLKTALAKYEEEAKSGQNRSRPADTAAALACRFSSSSKRRRWNRMTNCARSGSSIARPRFPWAAPSNLAAMNSPITTTPRPCSATSSAGDAWNDYRTAMFDHLQSSQNKDGSWPAAGIRRHQRRPSLLPPPCGAPFSNSTIEAIL